MSEQDRTTSEPMTLAEFKLTKTRNANAETWDDLGVFVAQGISEADDESVAIAVLVYCDGWTIEENADSYYLVLHREDYLADKTAEGLARLETILYEFMLETDT